MHLTQQLEACVARMTPEQYARLLAFAEALLAESSAPSAHDTVPQAVEAAAGCIHSRDKSGHPYLCGL